MVSLEQLQTWRAALLASRLRGVRRVRDSDGSQVDYATDREMSDAIAACDREIAALSGARSPRTIRFNTSKGV